MEYIAPGALLLFMVASLVAVNVKLKDKPSYRVTEGRYVKKELGEEIHKRVDEKLGYIPDIKKTVTQIETKINILLKNNGHR